MQLYGDEVMQIEGQICARKGNYFKIRFVDTNKTVFVPIFIMKQQIKENSARTQSITLPTWFLKKNRIIAIQ